MATVTVAGASGQTVTLNFDSNANAVLASRLAAAITSGVNNGTIIPAVDTSGPPPALPPGTTGEFIQTQDGTTVLPHGYSAFVDTAATAVVFGSADRDQSVLASSGNLDFLAAGGSGTIVAGGGNNVVSIPGSDSGNWSINTGNGNDNLIASGSGNDTISAGAGNNRIELGSGSDVIASLGNDNIVGGTGQETVTAFGNASDLIDGNASKLTFVGSSGSATIFGGSGSATQIFGGQGNDTFVSAGGTATVTAGAASNLFVFVSSSPGGTEQVNGFIKGLDQIGLQDFGPGEVNRALASQQVSNRSDTITLSDNTTVTFVGVSSLSQSDFVTINSKTNFTPHQS
jgi:Ca2+-binding RTX toxin-like protein